MTDYNHRLDGATLDEIAANASAQEIYRELEGLATPGGQNEGHFKYRTTSPMGTIRILAAPAVGPQNSTKICDGTLTINGNAIDVTAFRLPA